MKIQRNRNKIIDIDDDVEELSFVEEYKRLMKLYYGGRNRNMGVPEEWVGLVNKFEQSIESLCSSGEGEDWEDEQRKKKIRQICLHMVHVVSMLTWKYKSLQNGISALQDWTTATMSKTKIKNDDNVVSSSLFLEGWFHHYLRLRDGLHLLHSGECRHEGDIQQATVQNNKKTSASSLLLFRTRLTQGGKRQDGYTQLYDSSKVYSGYGWDEYYNETLGLRTRLFRLFLSSSTSSYSANHKSKQSKKKQIQKQLSKTIEIALDQIDIQIRSCQQELVKLIEKHKNDPKIKIVKLSLIDKMEQLTYYHTTKKEDQYSKKTNNATKNKITLQRPPNFTIQNDSQYLGAIPNHWTQAQWINSFSALMDVSSQSKQEKRSAEKSKAAGTAAPSKKKVKRRIIVESDDDDDDDNDDTNIVNESIADTGNIQSKQNKNGSISGCGFKKKEDNDERNDGVSSLREIKTQLGIDAVHLEQSRTALEEEQQDKSEIKDNDDTEQDYKEEIAQIQEEILQEKQQVSMYQQILQIANQNSNTSDIWDASESLRSSFMIIGNQLLELYQLINITKCSFDANLDKRKESLLRSALNYFKNSIPLVKKLQQMNNNGTNMDEAEYKSRLIALWLCLGRAHVNVGRTECDLFSPKTHSERYESNSSYKSIMSHFQEALDCAQNMLTESRDNQSTNLSTNSKYSTLNLKQHESNVTIFEAKELTSIANRWRGYFLWQCHKLDEAISALQSASGMNESNILFSYDHSSNTNKSTNDAYTLFLVQCYAGTSLLLNNISIHLHHYNEISLLHSTKKYEGIEIWYKIALNGFNHAFKILNSLDAVNTSQNKNKTTLERMSFTELVKEHHLDTPSILNESKKSLTQSWEDIQQKRKLCLQQKLSFHNQSHSSSPINSFPTGYRPLNTKKHKTSKGRIFVINAHGHKDRTHHRQQTSNNGKSQHNVNDDAFDNFGLQTGVLNEFPNENDMSTNNWEVSFRPVKTYRPWGDELISDPKAFPACSPPMPDEMNQEIL